MTLTPPITIPPPDDQLTAPSESLLGAFIDSGSPVIDCEWCGRVHFDANGEFMDPGELGRLMTKLDAEPDKYHTHDGGPHWGTLCGLQYVAGCPCNRAAVLEAFIWQNRMKIADFMARRGRHELLAATYVNTLVENLPELLNPRLPFEENPAEPKWTRCLGMVSKGVDDPPRQCVLRAGHTLSHAIEEPGCDKCGATPPGHLTTCSRYAPAQSFAEATKPRTGRLMWAVPPPDATDFTQPVVGTRAELETAGRIHPRPTPRCGLPGRYAMWACTQSTGNDSWQEAWEDEDLARELMRAEFDRGRDVWLIWPDGTKELPSGETVSKAQQEADRQPLGYAVDVVTEPLTVGTNAELPLAEGHRCEYHNPAREGEEQGRQCDGWIYPEGHRYHKKNHTHVFFCGKPLNDGSGDTCSLDEGHPGQCHDIPF